MLERYEGIVANFWLYYSKWTGIVRYFPARIGGVGLHRPVVKIGWVAALLLTRLLGGFGTSGCDWRLIPGNIIPSRALC
ncbi:MAG: hypothetical protein U1F42_09950 [Candidatus Competibacteraceae bacterium]